MRKQSVNSASIRYPAISKRKQEGEIAIGHCNVLPAAELPALARAQIARDIVMARSIRPYLERGVVLLAGNGHVRRDIGVPFWLPREAARGAISIGLLERDDDSIAKSGTGFDAYVVTEPAERPDPCKDLVKQHRTTAAAGVPQITEVASHAPLTKRKLWI